MIELSFISLLTIFMHWLLHVLCASCSCNQKFNRVKLIVSLPNFAFHRQLMPECINRIASLESTGMCYCISLIHCIHVLSSSQCPLQLLNVLQVLLCSCTFLLLSSSWCPNLGRVPNFSSYILYIVSTALVNILLFSQDYI